MSDLLKKAKTVRVNAHAPYSNFKVGAAVRSVDGNDFVGCNVENAAYPQGLCAEAGAIAAMIAAGDRQVKEICIVADSTQLITPCGGCRQKLAEFSETDTVVLVANLSGQSLQRTVGELLPDSFNPDRLGPL